MQSSQLVFEIVAVLLVVVRQTCNKFLISGNTASDGPLHSFQEIPPPPDHCLAPHSARLHTLVPPDCDPPRSYSTGEPSPGAVLTVDNGLTTDCRPPPELFAKTGVIGCMGEFLPEVLLGLAVQSCRGTLLRLSVWSSPPVWLITHWFAGTERLSSRGRSG